MKKIFSLLTIIVFLSSCGVNHYYTSHRPKTPHCVVGKVNLWRR